MHTDGLMFLTLFGAACVVFGLWLRPKWRRAKKQRGARARVLWLWLNSFGSIAAGAMMLGGVQIELIQLQLKRAHEAELARFAINCTQAALRIENRGDAPRKIKVSAPELLEWQGYLGERPEHWKAQFTDESAHVLAPGEHVDLPYQTTPGDCWHQPGAIVLDSSLLFRGKPNCELAFDFAAGDLEERLSCTIK